MVAVVSYTDSTLYRRLLRQARPYWPHIVGIFLLSLLESPLALLTPLPLKIAVDSVVSSHHLPDAPATGSGVTITGPSAVTTADGLRLRARPRLSAPVIETLARGTELGFRGYHTSWAAVVAPDGTQGYVLGSYVRLVGRATPQVARPTSRSTRRGAAAGFEAPFLIVDVRDANLRAAPSLTAPVIASAPYNTQLALRGIDGPWAHVETRTGISGWIMR